MNDVIHSDSTFICRITTGEPTHSLSIQGVAYGDALEVTIRVPRTSVKAATERKQRGDLSVMFATEMINTLRRLEEEVVKLDAPEGAA